MGEYREPKLKKATLKGRQLTVTYCEYRPEGDTDVTKKCEMPAHKDLTEAFKKLVPHFMLLTEMRESEQLRVQASLSKGIDKIKEDEFDFTNFTPRSQKSAGRPKSIVNKVTEYGALFNKLNDERTSKGLPPLKTAMEVLIDAMQSDELDIKDKAKIADKLAPFESSRAPIISVEHIQNVTREDEGDADDALNEFMESLRKV